MMQLVRRIKNMRLRNHQLLVNITILKGAPICLLLHWKPSHFSPITISFSLILPHFYYSFQGLWSNIFVHFNPHRQSSTQDIIFLIVYRKDPGGSKSQVVGLLNNSYKLVAITAWVRARLCKLQKGYTRLSATGDKVYQLLACPWFSGYSDLFHH